LHRERPTRETNLKGIAITSDGVGDLLDDYRVSGAFDEMFGGAASPREHYQSLHGVLQTLSRRDFEERCDARDRAFRDAGITFQLSGEERPFPPRA
jgi:uncharacterized circularly permuted ATP-grasp superfamily protein